MLSEEQSQKHITTGSGDLNGILGGGIHCKEVTEIDTEGSFMVERVYQIAEGCISDIMEYFPCHHDKSSSGQENLQPESFLAGIYYFRICSYTEQIAVINYLEKFLREHKDVRIVIIDSVTFHFRQDFDDLALRTRVLSGLSLKLMKISKSYNLAERSRRLFENVSLLVLDVPYLVREGLVQLGLARQTALILRAFLVL
ncbi:hypothetical protein TRIUR3_34347 [Triticum urartu]|uniref:DNA repair protein RAD51 homolog 3 n=1 Tax=Triticum urartu TaxID=4572 RepID=M8A757_TRIUA|nr:hypothetical protein TRIUR3_34347 [Triticum urartu]